MPVGRLFTFDLDPFVARKLHVFLEPSDLKVMLEAVIFFFELSRNLLKAWVRHELCR